MRIAPKLTLSLTLPLLALTAVIGYLYQRRSEELLREELSKEGRAIALVVQIASEDYLRDRQLADLREMADRIAGYERVLGVRLFDPESHLIYQSNALDPYPFKHEVDLRRVLAGGGTVAIRRQIGHQPASGFIVPLQDRHGRLLGAAQVLQLESYIRDDARSTMHFIVILGLAMAATIIATVLLVTRFSISRPIEHLVHSFREVGAEELPARVEVRTEDELGMLSREFNNMCERLETTHHSLVVEQERRQDVETQLQNAERLAGLGRLAAGLAHEIGTPLNVISGRTESLMRDAHGNPAAERGLRIIGSQIERIVRIVRDMLDFAGAKPPRRLRTDLTLVLGNVTDLLERQFEARGVRIETEGLEGLPRVDADPDQLEQVFLNLMLNAIDSMPEGGLLRITTRAEVLVHPKHKGPPRACVTVCIADSGTGIKPEDRDRVFDPFFTTKEAGQGTGLGLSVSYGIIEEHGGWFEIDTAPGKGTRITAILPLTHETSKGNPGGTT